MSSVGPTSAPSKVMKEGRKLACRLCQKRKKKCNRKSPCSMCIKLKVVCQPSTPAPTRKRRQSTKDLFARLAWCEEQLRRTIDARNQCDECLPSTETSADEVAEKLSEIRSASKAPSAAATAKPYSRSRPVQQS
ncbi:hypothetical protein TGAM01_v202132 [Trichoderma gamsii]|uniref:Zn(2)-C6 fungal-type domain-containing protein n=2 Tax=Trichoderma TaxID=5543 RepID=A0A2P4ZXJ5_9HYPO|nr:hypothetical protein TGAM01_v202132 [Trichoderma gamsii]PON29024.1 hypothetical protein TGAM01_v202132 [Trichoderma gamsii]